MTRTLRDHRPAHHRRPSGRPPGLPGRRGWDGPGIVGAKTAARLDARVLLERERTGGDCLWTGCVPSKALLAAAGVALGYEDTGPVALQPAATVDQRGRLTIAAIGADPDQSRLNDRFAVGRLRLTG